MTDKEMPDSEGKSESDHKILQRVLFYSISLIIIVVLVMALLPPVTRSAGPASRRSS